MTRKELIQQISEKQSFLCVGLDPDINKIPQVLKDQINAKFDNENTALAATLFSFCSAIADATAPYSVAFKPNLAFFEAYGQAGYKAYESLVFYLRQHHLHHFIIADAKRGDIGNTSAMYARSFFEGIAEVDALTVAPYMGEDSVKPFLGYEGKWVVLLALTSNKGSHDFQLTESPDGERLFEKVLRRSQQWATDEQMMYVVGATQGQMFEDVRRLAPTHFLLVPGVGAQGGSLQEVCRYGMNRDCGLLVNSSRGIIYASGEADFADAAAQKARELQEQMKTELQRKPLF